MTKEEAYNRIDAIIAKHEIDDVYVTITNFMDYDALRIARKTLEQEPCDKCVYSTSEGCQYDDITETIPPFETSDDAISRQAVLDLLENTNNGWIINEVLQLPPVNPQKPKTDWIPVSERLPEDKTYVLTTIKVPNRIAHARSSWYEGGFFHNDNGDTWRATDMEVKAWMPLPEPYKAEGSEE